MAMVLSHLRVGFKQGEGPFPQTKSDNAHRLSTPNTQLSTLNSQPAFTLLELLLVLAVLAVLSSIALPRVGRMLAKAEHQAAADGLRAALSQLRLKAIQTGRAYSLRYIPGSAIFELRAEDADEIGQIDFLAGDIPVSGILDQSLKQPRQEDSQSPRGGSGPQA